MPRPIDAIAHWSIADRAAGGLTSAPPPAFFKQLELMSRIAAFCEERMTPETQRNLPSESRNNASKLVEVRSRRAAHALKLASLQDQFAAIGKDISGRETSGVSDHIQTCIETIGLFDQLIISLERKTKAEMLGTFDRLASELIETSEQVGRHTAAVAEFMSRGQTIAAELDAFVTDAFQENPKVIQWWGPGSRGLFKSTSGAEGEARLQILREAASAGDFVKNRMASIRTILETEIARQH